MNIAATANVAVQTELAEPDLPDAQEPAYRRFPMFPMPGIPG